MRPSRKKLITGTFISAPALSPPTLHILPNHALGIDESGTITHSSPLPPTSSLKSPTSDDSRRGVAWEAVVEVARGWGWDGGGVEGGGERRKGVQRVDGDWEWWSRERGEEDERGWWFPGFVDTHIHASQYPNTGLFGKTTLLDWLNTYTFPLESSLSDIEKARRVYSACVSRTLSNGTTTASYFATTNVEATNLLADICLRKGQRAFVGRVCMDSDLSPEYYRDETPKQAIKDTKASITHITNIDPQHHLITPILTPRFAPSCSSHLLSELGTLASDTNLPIQTHISENTSECALVASLFPSCSSYADVYDKHGILTSRTVLAHAVHLSSQEKDLVKVKKAKISHCPVSNTSLSSGLCPVRDLLDRGIEVGLGTDVSGGYSTSILVAAREAGMVSRTLASVTPDNSEKRKYAEPALTDAHPTNHSTASKDRLKLSVEECLYLATRGGAHCLGLGDKVGAFEVGMQFDAQLIRLQEVPGEPESPRFEAGPVELWGEESWAEKVAKWLFCGDDRNCRKVFVRGELVHDLDSGERC